MIEMLFLTDYIGQTETLNKKEQKIKDNIFVVASNVHASNSEIIRACKYVIEKVEKVR